jgi:hypothetical protein
MLPLILLTLAAAAIIIGLYQLLIQKYYWGPKGPPQKREKDQDSQQK